MAIEDDWEYQKCIRLAFYSRGADLELTRIDESRRSGSQVTMGEAWGFIGFTLAAREKRKG